MVFDDMSLEDRNTSNLLLSSNGNANCRVCI